MKKCIHCNEECNDDVTICPKCGALVETYTDHKTYMDVYHINHTKKSKRKKLILWFLLGFVLPYIGFIVAWIMYGSEKEKAKFILIGCLIGTLGSTFITRLIMSLF